MPSEAVQGKTIGVAIFATLISGLVFYKFIASYQLKTGAILALTAGYLLLHPLLGRIFCGIVHRLCTMVDHVYEHRDDKRWGDWSLS